MSAIIASQQLEILIKELSKALISGFSRKIVIVPSDEVKSAIFSQLAEENGVAFGAKFYKPAQGVQAILHLSGYRPNFPSPNSLALHLEHELPKISIEKDYADLICQLFLRYAKVEGIQLHGWQKTLYEKIFSLWDEPAKFLSQAEPLDMEVHVFGAIPKLYREFFAKMPRARFYFLNPTQEFWGDLVSEKNRQRLAKFYERKGVAAREITQFLELTEEHHPLLANFGRLGGELFTDYLDYPFEERIVEPQGDALLHRLQKDLLYMKQSEYKADDSIQLHSACSLSREVEVLKTTLLNLLAENPEMQPSDIFVLAPNIVDYESQITRVFGSSDLPIPFEIQDLPFSRRSDPAQALLYLFSLQNCAWEREEILKFFHFSCVKEQLQLTDDELQMIEKWLCNVHLKWGFNEKHCVGTWEEAFRRLLLGLAMEEESEYLAHPIELSEAETLGRFLQAARYLHETLSVMENQTRTLQEWAYFIQDVCERFIGPATFQEELLQIYETLPSATYSFASIARAIRRTLTRSGDRVRSQSQNCVTFTSLKLGNARPAKVIALLGMEKFPHQETFTSLQQVPDLGPTTCEEDRYLFLEILISAREKLLFFYSNICAKDGREQSVSFLVQELMEYLKLDLHVSHPPYPFHSQYLLPDAPIKEFSPLNFAKATKKLPRKPFFQGIETEKSTTITTSQLKKLAKNPLRFYLNETLGIYLPFEYEEEFLLAPWEKNSLKQLHLSGQLEITEHVRKGEMPSGLFERVALLRLEKELEPLPKTFELFSVELKESCEKPYELHEKKWILPALQIEDVKIVGEIENLSKEGMVHLAGSKLHELLPIWPLFLVFQKIALQVGCKPDLLLPKEEKRLSLSEEFLKCYLDYFEQAKRSPSPFTPRATENLLKGKPAPVNTQFVDPHLHWAEARMLPKAENGDAFTLFIEKEKLVYSPLT